MDAYISESESRDDRFINKIARLTSCKFPYTLLVIIYTML